MAGPVDGAPTPPSIPDGVTRAVSGLEPGTELDESHRPGPRSGGSLAHGWTRFGPSGMRHRIGFPPPHLTSLVGPAVVEHLAVPNHLALPGGRPEPVALIAYLPAGSRWETARWGGGVTTMLLVPHSGGPWPMPSLSRQTIGRDYRGEDFAIVEVQGVVVGVQVGRAGTCELTWTIRRAEEAVHMSLWTCRPPLAALGLAVANGVLL